MNTPYGNVPDYLSLLRLSGQGFVVLGAGQGIGAQAALALAQAGARVLCVDRDAGLAQAIAQQAGGVACAADATSRPDMQRVFDTARACFGRVHGAVDIIGVAGIKPIAAVDDVAWAQQFDIVLRHAWLAIQIGAEMMAADGGGSLAFVGSMSGNLAVRSQVAYGTAKAALHHLVRSAAVEYAPRGVRINGVAPGYVRTPRLNQRLSEDAWSAIGRVIPMGAAALPCDIAGPLLFLCSALAGHVTGQVLAVDGGAGIVASFPDISFGPSATPTP